MLRRLAISVAITCAVVAASAAPALAQDPPGNNGTVKVDDQPLDSIPNNNPHVGCEFRVDFYGFDEGDLNASVMFELQPPTASGRTLTVVSGDLNPFIGGDAAGGGTDLDASETYVLAFTGAPHPQQGYHVKLTIHAPGSIGADTKHKVFWVESCPPEEPPGNGEEPPGNGEKPPGNGEKPPGNGEKPPADGKPSEEPTPVTIPTAVPAGVDNSGSSAGMAGLLVIAAGILAGVAVLIRHRVFSA